MLNKRTLSIVVGFFVVMLMISGCSLFSSTKIVDQVGGEKDHQGDSTVPVKDSTLAKHVPGQVVIKTTNKEVLNKILKDFNGKIIAENKELKVYKVNIDVSLKGSLVKSMQIMKLYANIDYVEPVYIYAKYFDLTDSEYYSRQWGPISIGLHNAFDIAINKGNSITIGIVDTGVDYTHPEFDGTFDEGGRVLPGYNAFNDLEGYDAAWDEDGHGTHVAGIAAANINANNMAGIAPLSYILPVRVLDENGFGTDYSVADGIIWAVNNGANVINLSLGGKGYSQVLQAAIDYAIVNNVAVVVAMGNSGKNEVEYPAACTGVISVGAVDGRGEIADFSTMGRHISVSAPGVAIYSAIPGESYESWNGTSMATPHVTGAIALLLGEEPSLTVSEIKTRLESSAMDIEDDGFDEKSGYGIINLVNLLHSNVLNKYGNIEVYVEVGGYPASGVDVLVTDENGQTVKNVKANEDGYANIYNLESGIYIVITNAWGYKFEEEVNVTVGETAEVAFVQEIPTSIKGYVVDSQGGSGVEYATINIIGEIDSYTILTDADGYFSIEVNPDIYEINSSKEGYAGSKYQDVIACENREISVTIIQREIFSDIYSVIPPTINVDAVVNGDILSGEVDINVSVNGDNAIKFIVARIGHGDFEPDIVGEDTELVSFTINTALYANGESFIDILVYDVNDNVARLKIPVIFENAIGFGFIPETPEWWGCMAVTFGESLGLYRENRGQIFERLNKSEDPNILLINGKEFNICSAPEDSTIAVILDWDDSYDQDGNSAIGYKVFRSFSPIGPFEEIADVFYPWYNDFDPALNVGRKVYYKIAAYDDDGMSMKSEAVWTEPIEKFNVTLETPINREMNVSLNPIFTWYLSPIMADEIYYELYVGGTTDEYPVWDVNFYNKESIQYIEENLIPGKEYEWDIYYAEAYKYYGYYSMAISLSGQGDGSINGAFTFTTDPEAVPLIKTSILEMDISETAGFTDEIVVEIISEGNYTFETSYYYQGCDTVLTLYDEDYNQIGYNDDIDYDCYSRINKYLLPGIYYVVVEEFSEDPLYCHLSVTTYE
ncbi:MAG: S8 family serine peptidase [Halanaerobiales bacterium]|nr:S8 family serine peptidase [Halanaerobiales bacterium]